MDVLWFAAGSQAEPFGGTGIYAWWRALGPPEILSLMESRPFSPSC